MTRSVLLILMACSLMWSCRSDHINYTRALFEHVPEDPDVLVLVRPDDVTRLMELAAQEIDFQEMIGAPMKVNVEKLDQYRNIAVKMFEQLGIPWQSVETIGYMRYLEQSSFMVAGEFRAAEVESKLTELGFKRQASGYFEYVYSGQELHVVADGLMVMAPPDVLSDVADIPTKNRLWNRDDFKKYRESSPLDNSLFVWSHPPENMLSNFQYRDILGDVSLAVNFRNNLTLKATVRITDPDKTVQLYNIIFGAVTVGKGFLGDDPELGPVLDAITVSQDNREVAASLVVSASQLQALKERFKKEFQNNESSTFDKIDSFLKNFQ